MCDAIRAWAAVQKLTDIIMLSRCSELIAIILGAVQDEAKI